MGVKPILEARNVTKVYGLGRTQVVAVRAVSLRILAGECVALMGPSGSGKSTLLKVLGLILRPTEGSVLIRGEEVACDEFCRARLRNKFFGYVDQEFAIIENESVERNVMIPLQYANPKPGRQEIRARTRQALEEVGLGWALKKNASQLSGGERQRVAIARALVNEPLVILADEPTAALDGKTTQEIMTLFLSIKARGAAVLITTHDDRVAKQCDRILRMIDGRLVE
ncbi:ABC transporter ATP-binding protein [Hydrogenibacillus sp. N12]|uniref:ABC transporter ATP-binding protein n=1 Tax=Hydrogenibacillus sp. N12 TaxID=2866627 RepID=UPI00207BF3EA|nr:ABC transporter ATP-binding protein [Hydrogenibacillus sp. N12]